MQTYQITPWVVGYLNWIIQLYNYSLIVLLIFCQQEDLQLVTQSSTCKNVNGEPEKLHIGQWPYTVKAVYKGESREPENVPFMGSWPLYRGYKLYALFINGKNDKQ